MPYITSVERIGIQQGLEQGLEQGRREELLAGIALALDLKFGDAGLALLPEIQRISEVARLQTIRDRIKAAGTPEELRQVYAAPDDPA